MSIKRRDGFEDRREHFAKLSALAEESWRTGTPIPPMEERGVPPFQDPIQNVIEFTTIEREYHHPFNYRNVTMYRHCKDPANSGLEINPVNVVIGRTGTDQPPDYGNEPGDFIQIVESRPIVRVAVIGSACTPPGYVTLEAEPCEGFRRPDEVVDLQPLRMRIDNLWGAHIRGDVWMKDPSDGGNEFPEHFIHNWPFSHSAELNNRWRFHNVMARNWPLAGMSCAIFEIPASKKVRISGGGQVYGWTDDGAQGDIHYSFRAIRLTVLDKYEAVIEE
jgi:hypothetical protein